MNIQVKSTRRRRQGKAGFTLMELMLVLGIISLLIVAGVRVGPMVMNSGRESKARADVGTLSGFVMQYQNTHSNRLPSSLRTLVDKGMISEEMLQDPWGNDYKLVSPAKRSKDKFDLYSMGKNGLDQDDDDVGNWESQ